MAQVEHSGALGQLLYSAVQVACPTMLGFQAFSGGTSEAFCVLRNLAGVPPGCSPSACCFFKHADL